jgi:gliding motility-associated-like protein
MNSRLLVLYTFFYLVIGLIYPYSQGCIGLKADAGPDQATCDPNMPIQLMGSFNGTPIKYFWTPATFLSDPNTTDPIVNAPPGKYKYTFNVEALSNTNLIINGNFESGNTGFTHDYNYGSPGGPFGPGWLSVGTTPPSYNGSWSNCGDHTTGSGNQLIIDGSTTPNSNVWCQTVPVTAGKMYLFRFYIQSIYPANPPNLIALANGVSIGSVSGAGVCDWQTFEACFTATSSTVKMCIQETSLIGFGNDFAIDDIEMYEKCMDKDEVDIEIVDLKAKIQVPQQPKCGSDIFDLNGIGSSAGPNIRYEWRSEGGKIISQNGLSARGQGSGKYFIKIIYQNGNVICEKEDEVDVNPPDELEGTLEVEGISNCNADTILLKATASNGSGNFDYQWIPANKILRGQHDSVAYVTEAGLYKVVIIDMDSGCEVEIQDVVVSDTLRPNLQISGDTLISCIKNKVLLFGNPFDTSRYSYEWKLPDSSRIKNKDTILSNSSGLFSLKIIDNVNKCYTEKFLTVKTDTGKPNVDLGPDQKIDCNNSDKDIIPIANNANAVINYYWTLPSGIIPVETSLLNKKVNTAGRIILRLVNTTNGCEISDTLFIDDIRVLPSVDAGNGSILNCKLKDYTLDGTNSKIDSSRFFWSTSNGNILSGANTLNPVVNAPGWYYLNLEDTINHCRNIDSVYINQNILTPIAKLGPDRVFTCADSILTLDGSNSSQGGQLRYNWISPNGIIDSGQGTQFIKIKSAGDYYLIVLDSINFCSDTDLISVKPDLNAPVANISVNDTLTCLQPSVMLFGTASSPSGDPVIYHWSASSGQVIQNPNSLSPIVTEPGEYLLTVIDQLNGCSTTVKDTVTIDTIKPIASTGNSGIWNCSTTQFTLDGSNSTGTHGLQFQWTTTDGSILSNNQKNRIDIGAPGTYTLKVIDLVNGCESIDQIVVQKDLNIPVASIQFPDTLNCFRSTVMLSGQGSSTGNRIQYNWNTNNGQIIGSTNQINILVDKPGTYQIIVTDTTNKCKQQQTVTVIEDKLQPVVDAGNPAILYCQLTDLILTATISTPGNHNLIWKTNQGNILSKTDSLQIKINKPGIYFIDVTNTLNGCSGTDSVLVTKINNLTVDAGSSNELTCSLLEATLNGSLQNGAGNEQFIWSTIQGHFTGNPNAAQVKADRPGWYYFIVNNNATGCNGIDSVLITENTNRPTTINLDVQQPKCPGDSWLTNITNISGGEKPLQVFLNNQLVNGLTMQGNAPGNYSIKVVDKNGCELSSGFNIITPTGVAVQLVPLVRLSAGDDYNLVPMYSIPDDSIASVQWSPSDFLTCTNCPYPQIKGIDQDLEYTVTYTNRNGCIASARIRIEIIKRNIWIPNAFSPNGDNINDSFYPVVSEDSYQEIKSMQIFDRWGNLLFSRMHFPPNDPFYGWNGDANHEHLNPGTFVYVIEVVWKNGETEKRFGDVTLIR